MLSARQSCFVNPRLLLSTALIGWLLAGCIGGVTSVEVNVDTTTRPKPDAGGEPPGSVTDTADSGPSEARDVDAPREPADIQTPEDSTPDSEPSDAQRADTPEAQDADEPPAPPPQKQAFFNAADVDGTPDLSLEDLVIDMVNQTPAGAKIRASYYTFTRTRMPQAFIDAKARGVDVKFVLDNANNRNECDYSDAVSTLIDGLDPSNVTVCRDCQGEGGCIGIKINHNKFILFSELDDGSQNVVLQSSANLTNPQIVLYNNTVVIRDDQKLYDAYLNYWADLKAQRQDPNYYHKVVGSTGTKAYFFPRNTGDTVVNLINNLDCSEPDGQIRVAMAFFAKSRRAVAEALVGQKRAGCRVQVLLGDEELDSTTVQILEDDGVDTLVYTLTNGVTIHSKYMLLDGHYIDKRQKLVFTGSHNYTISGLERNDETLLKINDSDIYEAFLDNWQLMHERQQAL